MPQDREKRKNKAGEIEVWFNGMWMPEIGGFDSEGNYRAPGGSTSPPPPSGSGDGPEPPAPMPELPRGATDYNQPERLDSQESAQFQGMDDQGRSFESAHRESVFNESAQSGGGDQEHVMQAILSEVVQLRQTVEDLQSSGIKVQLSG